MRTRRSGPIHSPLQSREYDRCLGHRFGLWRRVLPHIWFPRVSRRDQLRSGVEMGAELFITNQVSTNNAAFQAGMASTLTASPWTTGVGFYISSANSVQNDWYCAYVSTYTDTGVTMTPGIYQRLTIVNNGTTASAFINGQPTSTGCTAVAVSGFPSFSTVMIPSAYTSVSLTASTSYTMYVDYTTFQRAETVDDCTRNPITGAH